MDKISHFQKAIRALLQKHQYHVETTDNDVLRDEIIEDTQHHHYQLVTVGWKNDRYFFAPLFHLHIANNKIWLQQNNTEWRIADELMELGIDRQDIVLGFVEPSLRQYSEFAAMA
jgi:hypothetical protein